MFQFPDKIEQLEVGIGIIIFGTSFFIASKIATTIFYRNIIYIILVLISIFLIIHGMFVWKSRDKTDKELKEHDLKTKTAQLKFKIKSIRAEWDIDIQSISEYDYKKNNVTNYQIEIVVNNPSTIDNCVSEVIVFSTKCGECHSDFINKQIKSRHSESISFSSQLTDNHAPERDVLKITIKDIDGKEIINEQEIDNYQRSETYKEEYPDINDLES